jgi:transcriptional regulator with XRE-family HTH domain
MYQNPGQQIRKIRRKRGMSQSRFGNKIGVSGKTISAYETGKIMPSLRVLQKISVVYEEYVQLPDIRDRDGVLETLNIVRNKLKEIERKIESSYL